MKKKNVKNRKCDKMFKKEDKVYFRKSDQICKKKHKM